MKLLRPLSLLALLALAAASSAQVFTLSPVALSGYTRNSAGAYALTSELTTHVTPFGFSRGWRAEFAPPAVPNGTRLVFAKFGARGSNWNSGRTQRTNVSTYSGTGTILPAPGPFVATVWSGARGGDFTLSVDATRALGTGQFVGFDLSCDPPGPGSTISPISWSSPTLTVGYGHTIRVPLNLDGYRGDVTKVLVRFEIRPPGTTDVVYGAYAYPDAGGVVEIGVPAGTYDLAFKPSHWLRRTLRSVVVSGPKTLPSVAFINGDADGDNVVSAADRAMVTYGLGTIPGQDNYHLEWDMNGDGAISALDRAIVTARLGSVGDN